MRGLAMFMAGDGGHHQYENQHRRNGLEAGDEQVAQQCDRFGRLGRDQGQDDAQHQADRDLGNQAQAPQALEQGEFCSSHRMSPR